MGNRSIGNRQLVHARCSLTLQTVASCEARAGVRWDRVFRIRTLLAQGAYNVSSACVADAILRRGPATAQRGATIRLSLV